MISDKILISVVIPSYNRADTVGQTIDSILAQQVDADVEIVIGNLHKTTCHVSHGSLRRIRLKFPGLIPRVLQDLSPSSLPL